MDIFLITENINRLYCLVKILKTSFNFDSIQLALF